MTGTPSAANKGRLQLDFILVSLTFEHFEGGTYDFEKNQGIMKESSDLSSLFSWSSRFIISPSEALIYRGLIIALSHHEELGKPSLLTDPRKFPGDRRIRFETPSRFLDVVCGVRHHTI